MDASRPDRPRAMWLLEAPAARESLVFSLVLAALASLPFLLAAIPQMTDYPSHLAAFKVMLDQGRDPFLARYYAVDWRWTGNMGTELLIWPLSRLLGLEAAGKLIAAAIPVLTGLGIVAAEWTLRRRVSAGGILAFACIWSPSFGQGFLNFSLSLALALFALVLWIRLEGRSWRGLLFMPIGLIVWLCHVAGWGILGVMVFGWSWSRDRSWRAFVEPWPLLLPFAPLLLGGGTTGLFGYGPNPLGFKLAILLKALRNQSAVLDLFTVFLMLAVVIRLCLRGRVDTRLGWAALLLAGLSLVLPRHIAGGDLVDARLIPVALMLGCMAVGQAQTPRWMLGLAALPFVARLAVTSLAWHASGREMDRMLLALERVPVGARIAGAVAVDKLAWPLDPLEHVTSMAAVRRSALINSLFSVPGLHMVRVIGADRNFVDPSHRLLLDPGQHPDLRGFAPLRQVDYLWYIGDEPLRNPPPGMTVLYRSGHTFMARLAKPHDAR